MAFAQGAVAKVVATMQDENGSLIENVYFYQNTGAGDIVQSSFMTAVEAELSTMYAFIENYIPDTCLPVSIEADVVAFSGGKLIVTQNIGEIAWTTWSGGTGTGEGLPQGCAAVCSFPSVSPGAVGRKYFGPLTETAQGGGELISGLQTALASLIAEFLDGFSVGTDTCEPCVMSTKYAALKLLVSGIVNAVVGYQRRRKNGVGS